ncbi:uncharacterized protein LOC141619939 [Silene latifolia]|uniref:uncharacterized protein LOC141619939 n=1 Tax=Silene latifolia TaxID=37657 RepID=UPI003D7825C8
MEKGGWSLRVGTRSLLLSWLEGLMTKISLLGISLFLVDGFGCSLSLEPVNGRVGDHLLNLAGSVQSAKLLLNAWTVNSTFSFQSAYAFYRNAPAADNWTSGLAHSSIVPSHKIICSLAVQHQLATMDNIQRRGIPYVNRCALCLAQEETHAHLFFSYPVSSAIWQQLLLWMGISRVISSLQEELASIGSSRHWRTDWLATTLAATVHQLWAERNKRIFQGIDQPISCIVKRIKFQVAVRMFK